MSNWQLSNWQGEFHVHVLLSVWSKIATLKVTLWPFIKNNEAQLSKLVSNKAKNGNTGYFNFKTAKLWIFKSKDFGSSKIQYNNKIYCMCLLIKW